ncbi:MAG: hypothetical protein JWQ03_3155 [Variovorax sp.]|nr:hypothetical protein [Variovorax sp.]
MITRQPTIPHPLLDKIAADFRLKNDYQLARFLGVGASVLSKLRTAHANGGMYKGSKYRLSGDVILAIHEKTGMSVAQIKALAGQA